MQLRFSLWVSFTAQIATLLLNLSYCHFLIRYSEATNHKDRNDMCASQCSELKYSSYHSSNMHSRDPYDYERRKRRASAASSCSVMSTSSYESGLYTVHFSEVKARSVLEEFSRLVIINFVLKRLNLNPQIVYANMYFFQNYTIIRII